MTFILSPKQALTRRGQEVALSVLNAVYTS